MPVSRSIPLCSRRHRSRSIVRSVGYNLVSDNEPSISHIQAVSSTSEQDVMGYNGASPCKGALELVWLLPFSQYSISSL